MSPRVARAPEGWWASLRHGGLLIAPSKLEGRFPDTLPELPLPVAARLRRDLVRFRAKGDGALSALLDTMFHEVLELHPARWIAGSAVDATWTRTAVTGEAIRPRRVWLGPHDSALAVFISADEEPTRAGAAFLGRGRRAVARVVEWLRKTGRPIALLVLGRSLRLVHAGTDYEAFCEWDTDLWMQEGGLGPQVDALRALLHHDAIAPAADGQRSRLVAAIQATRQGQAELSESLGERVRTAVEALIAASKPALDAIDGGDRSDPATGKVARRDIYIAATRMVMRCVVLLFAESREGLLPRHLPTYEGSYGITGLRVELQRRGHGRAEQLRYGHAAWPRLLALFSLIHRGSAHEALPVTAYGGSLFAPGDPESPDPVTRAVAAFEGENASPSDAVVHALLELLCVAPVRVRQGRGSKWVQAPVDFSDLSSEYIGILYEGLLDFELRRADEAIVFLRLGDEPALLLDRLDKMTNQELAQLLGKLAEKKKKGDGGDANEEAEDEAEDGEEDDEETESREEDAGAEAEQTIDPRLLGQEEARRIYREPVQLWAERAVQAAKLVPYPKRDIDAQTRDRYQREVAEKGRWLVKRAVMPGEWFLVRWGGTRKGSGTFYTRPQLAGPIVRRALQPLAYVPVREEKDEATGVVTVAEWAPKKPEEILRLKVCDPAMGSGSFLISGLRYLTSALHESLHFHGRLLETPAGTIPRLADGNPATSPEHEPLPVRREHPEFENRLRARLKRYVVERCLYGVDLDPLAVELARMALWLETMDRELPFGFLDHKLKVGNSLVGCWFDRFQEYPILAWEREGGDKGHDRFVHHYREFVAPRGKDKGQIKREGDKWTAAIKARKDDVIKPALARWIGENVIGQDVFPFAAEGKTPEIVHDEAMAVLEELHRLPVSAAEEREKLYREKIQNNPAMKKLREAFDTWCALWFWPGDELEKAPGPYELLSPEGDAREVVKRVREEMRFFHWEIEFPDVFAKAGAGFDAVVGNPPWETQKPNSLEFFSNLDPLYRTYTKQEALKKQTGYFDTAAGAEDDWIRYSARFKGMNNWTKNAADPFGLLGEEPELTLARGKEGEALRRSWKKRAEERKGYTESAHPFRYQGAGMDANTYKMFLEFAYAALSRHGVMGFLTPSGIYTDNGCRPLRELLLRHCAWTHLYAFQNERFVFEGIDHRFKMAVLHATKGHRTTTLLARYRVGPGDSPDVEEVERDLASSSAYLATSSEQILSFSPSTGALLELRDAHDLLVTEKMYRRSMRFGDGTKDSWEVLHRQEFHMTHDANLYLSRTREETSAFRNSSIDGIWDGGGDAIALPLVQGVAMDAFNYNAKRWVHGTGVRAVWEKVAFGPAPVCDPQFLVLRKNCLGRIALTDKLVYRRIARSTDTRTVIATAVPGYPVGDVTPTVRSSRPNGTFALLAILNSFVFDSRARQRCGGTHVDYHVMAELPLPKPDSVSQRIPLLAIRVGAASPAFSPVWLRNKAMFGNAAVSPWRRLWAVTPYERLRLRCILDAVVAALYGLDENDFRWILRDCDHPTERVTNKPFSRTLDPKGFWRVDKEKDPELRHTVLSLVAFRDMQRAGGIDPFLALNDREGWMLPDTLRLADYDLGHDARAASPQPVASRLGPRFFDWQLTQTVEESWAECERHAENIRKLLGLPAPTSSEPSASESASATSDPSSPSDTAGAPSPGSPAVVAGRSIDTKTGQFGLFIEPGSQRTLEGWEAKPDREGRRR